MTLHDHQLQAENDRLRQRVADLEKVLEVAELSTPKSFRMTGSENKIFGLIVTREFASREQIMSLLYAGKIWPGDSTLNVFINRIRKKLPEGIEIKNEWGAGYYMSAEHRVKVAEMLAAERCEA